jgi:hypothetical protein
MEIDEEIDDAGQKVLCRMSKEIIRTSFFVASSFV